MHSLNFLPLLRLTSNQGSKSNVVQCTSALTILALDTSDAILLISSLYCFQAHLVQDVKIFHVRMVEPVSLFNLFLPDIIASAQKVSLEKTANMVRG